MITIDAWTLIFEWVGKFKIENKNCSWYCVIFMIILFVMHCKSDDDFK